MIRVARPSVGEEEAAAVREVLLSGKFVSGRRVEQFEQSLGEYVGADHVVATNSGTSALHLALVALGVGPGDEVIVPAVTFFATVSSVLQVGATPVFADISGETLCLDPEDVSARVTHRTCAILFVHLFGCPGPVDELTQLCRSRGIRLVEDCAQAHGARTDEGHVGTIGDVGAFSFFATKNMTTGEGGALVTNDPTIANDARLRRSHGMTSRHTHEVLGYNYRMTEIAAAIGIAQLDRLDELNRRRIDNSKTLQERLGDVPWLQFPQAPVSGHVYFWCPVRVNRKLLGMETTDLIDRLREDGVECRNRYLEPLYRQPALAAYRQSDGTAYDTCNLPVSEAAAPELIGLPNHPDLTDDEIDTVVTIIRGIST